MRWATTRSTRLHLVVALAGSAVIAAACGEQARHVTRVGPNVDASDYPGWQAEVAIAVDPKSPRVLVAASNAANRAGIRTYTSIDGGRTWVTSVPPLPRGTNLCGHGDPAVA